FSTVAGSMKDDWVADRVAAVRENLEKSAKEVARDRARDDMLAELKQLCTPQSSLDPDQVYARYEALKTTYPDLARYRPLEDAMREAEQFEVRQVKYEAAAPATDNIDAVAAARGERSPSATLWLLDKTVPAHDKVLDDASVVLALARGVLYAFDA